MTNSVSKIIKDSGSWQRYVRVGENSGEVMKSVTNLIPFYRVNFFGKNDFFSTSGRFREDFINEKRQAFD